MPMGQHNSWMPNYNNQFNNTPSYNNISYNNNAILNNDNNSQPFTNMLSVMGPESAKAYPLPKKSDVILFDDNNPFFYWKSTDDNGFPRPLKAYRFEEVDITETQPVTASIDTSNFATKEDLTTLEKNISQIKEILEGLVN